MKEPSSPTDGNPNAVVVVTENAHDEVEIDLAVCPAVAKEQAPSHAGSVDDEIALLVVHGILHILGFDHATAGEQTEMQARERKHLMNFFWHGEAPDGFSFDHRAEVGS